MSRQETIINIKNKIIENADIYSSQLAGRYYLYIFDNKCFEMYYGTENYLHLTGVGTNLSSSQFYQLAKNGQLQTTQLFFNERYPIKVANKKTTYLANIENFIREDNLIIKNLITTTCTYPYAIVNRDLSILLGIKEETIDNIYIPKSFRVKGNIFNKTIDENVFNIDYILGKKDFASKYDLVFFERNLEYANLDEEIKDKIDDEILHNIKNNKLA